MNKKLNISHLYNEYYNYVKMHILAKVNNNFVAEELTNDTFIKLNKHIERYDEKRAKITTLLLVIVNNIVIDYYRRRKLDTISIDIIEKDYTPNSFEKNYNLKTKSNYGVGDVMLNNKELFSIILKEINNLPEKYIDIAKLRIIDDLSYNDICKELDVSLSNVKTLLHKSRKILVKKLESVKQEYEF